MNVDEAFQNSWSKLLVSGKNDVIPAIWKVFQEPPSHGGEVVLSPLASLVILDSFTDPSLELYQSCIQLGGGLIWDPATLDVELGVEVTVSDTALSRPEVLQFQISSQSSDGLVQTGLR